MTIKRAAQLYFFLNLYQYHYFWSSRFIQQFIKLTRLDINECVPVYPDMVKDKKTDPKKQIVLCLYIVKFATILLDSLIFHQSWPKRALSFS